MNTFNLTKEEWYEKRNDRTRRIIHKNLGDDFSVGISVNSEIVNSFSLQYMTMVTCNILARWCPKICIDISECKSLIPKIQDQSFTQCIKHELEKIDPFGNFTFEKIKNDKCNLTLSIGKPSSDLDSFYWIDAHNWISGCGFGHTNSLPINDIVNPSSLALSACIGNSLLFKQAIYPHTENNFSKYFSLLDNTIVNDMTQITNPEINIELDLGKICQIGCGAVGSSLSYLLSLSKFHSDQILVDYDTIVYENCNSSLAFSAYDAQNSLQKVDVCKSILESKQISVKSFNCSYNDYVKQSTSSFNPDLLLCLANEQNVWITIQENIPPIVLHGTTSPNWAINFGRHIPISEWCILCKFVDFVNTTKTACSQGEISKENDKAILGTLPFLSASSAAFLLAELIKLNSNLQTKENSVYFEFNTLSGNSIFHGKRHACTCTKQFSLYPTFRNNTKFSSLFLSKS